MTKKKVKFPSASSMAKKKHVKPKKIKEESVRMMGLMSQRRGTGGDHAAY